MVICTICNEPVVDQGLAPSSCKHVFHYTCLNGWMNTRPEVQNLDAPFDLNNYVIQTTQQCPNCRAMIRAVEIVLDVDSEADTPPPDGTRGGEEEPRPEEDTTDFEDFAEFIELEERMEYEQQVPVMQVAASPEAAAAAEPQAEGMMLVVSGPWMPPESAYCCQFCGKTFNTTSAKSQHLHIHNPEKLTCPTCGTFFKYPGNLRAHRKKFRH